MDRKSNGSFLVLLRNRTLRPGQASLKTSMRREYILLAAMVILLILFVGLIVQTLRS